MLQDYDESSLKSMFREVLEDLGFKPKPSAQTGWDVGEEDFETNNIVPPHTSGDDPVSVKIVASEPTIVVQRGSLTWGGMSTIVNAVPNIIVGRDRRRRSVTIKNLSLNDIAIGPDAGLKYVAPGGFGPAVLPGGDSVTLHTCGDIHAVAASTSTGEAIAVYQIFDDGQ